MHALSKKKTRIAIAGAGGRMGRQLVKSALQMNNIEIGAAIEYKHSSFLGKDAGELAGVNKIGITVNSSLFLVKDLFDVFIDFTYPESTLDHLEFCQKYNKKMIIGTTGLNKIGQEKINKVSRDIAIVVSSNFSVGINVILTILQKVAKAIGNHSDIKILDVHHRSKTDSPSGTAIAMAKVITSALDKNKNLKNDNFSSYEKNIDNCIFKKIDFLTIRADDIIGEHTVMFFDAGEKIEIIHKASSRTIFANGALKASLWIQKQKNGLFDMKDVLEFNNL